MLLDSNLIIYATKPENKALRGVIAREAPYVSFISQVETLGYHGLTDREKRFLHDFFDAADVLMISRAIIDSAIRLRQQRRMSLGDALIAGTAICYGLTLATHNTKDFAWIDGLDIVDLLTRE